MNKVVALLTALIVVGCTSQEAKDGFQFHYDYSVQVKQAVDAASPEVRAVYKALNKNKRMCDYGGWRKENGFASYEQCAEHYAQEIAELLGLAESRYEQVDRRMAAREGVYATDRARRDRVAGDLARGLSSVAAEVSGAPVNIPTVADDYFHRTGEPGGRSPTVSPAQSSSSVVVTPDANSNHCLTKISRGARTWYSNACPYTVDVMMCLVTIRTHGTGCGQKPDYYTLPYRLAPTETILDDGSVVHTAVCRLIYPGMISFLKDGFDGEGGFRCAAG